MEPLQTVKLSFKCPKQLNELQPCNGDWYCDGCHKIVHDFRGMSEPQILDAFAKSNYQMCGMFEAGRIEVLPQQVKWFKWVSAAMVFLGIAGLPQFIYAQVNKTTDSLTIKKAQVEDTTEIIAGGITNVSNRPLLTGKVVSPVKSVKAGDDFFGVIALNPEFIGGEKALVKYLSQHIKNEGGFTGRAFASFVVQKDGSLADVKIVRSAGKVLDAEIIKAIKKMPKWRPGIDNGRPVKVTYTIPVNFTTQTK